MRERGGEWWRRVVEGEQQGLLVRLSAGALWGASLVYGAALKVHLAGYRLGLARRTRVPALVVSIGNLTLGGTGKTSAAIAVARWLTQRRRPAYLSRGYRGQAERRVLVVSEGAGPLAGVEEAGDEAVLAATKLGGVPVVVGKDRRRSAAEAIARFGADALVLDDGLQYQRLEKDLEIALLDALNPFGYDFLVPRGLLREPPRHLARANAVWLTHCDLRRRAEVDALRRRVGELAPEARVWESVHRPVRLHRLDADEEAAPKALRGRRVCALSSVGNPVSFERTLERLGAEVVTALRFPDHHAYRGGELVKRVGAGEWVVTTEKDAVRLPREALPRPTWCLEVELAERPGCPPLAEELEWLLSESASG